MGFATISDAVSTWTADADATELREECAILNGRIEEIVQERRSRKAHSATLATYQTNLSAIATNAGLRLEELSLMPAKSAVDKSENRWRLVSSGSAAAWGRFFSTIEDSRSSVSLISGNWMAKGWTNRTVNGDLQLILREGGHR
jgi:hypothetical protein